MRPSVTRRGFLALAGTAAVGTGAVSAGIGTDNTGNTTSDSVRFATYNVTDLRAEQVQSPGDKQAAAAARVIQEVRPDVLVLCELANNLQASLVRDVPPTPSNAQAFVENYLSDPQHPDLHGIEYPYIHSPRSNTGIHSGLDLDNNGVIDDTYGDRTYGNDAYGFGEFPGQYALAIFSQYPIQKDEIRSFRTFLWTDMPNSLIPRDPSIEMYLTTAEANQFHLSSKTHVDVPLVIKDKVVHALAAHPTPPVFDGEGNFNGRRNHDEIRLLADYVAGADYIYDDSVARGGTQGGLAADASYVLMGDMNAAPTNEGNLNPATEYFVNNNNSFIAPPFPTSPGGAEKEGQRSKYWTAEFELQVDYVLPSPDLGYKRSAVVWPSDDTQRRGFLEAVRTASDHRLVWADIAIDQTSAGPPDATDEDDDANDIYEGPGDDDDGDDIDNDSDGAIDEDNEDTDDDDDSDGNNQDDDGDGAIDEDDDRK